MKKNLFICLILCSFAAFSCGPSRDEFNRISAENAQLKEDNLALKAALEQCEWELDKYKRYTIREEPIVTNGKEVVGKWKVALSFSLDKYYTVEIINEKGKYHSKLEFSDSDKVKIEQLKKDGDKFFVVGSKSKDYYRIINGDLHLCDKDGDFTKGAGYVVTRMNLK
ncbi:MAG: hypothetical protein J5640_04080 [Bacteroidales bacterium]|nr:hypothetical protein [Bacteroidales bacterium]